MLATFMYVLGFILGAFSGAIITYAWMRLRYLEARVHNRSDVTLTADSVEHPDNLRGLAFSTAEKQREMMEAATRGHNPDQSW